MTTSNVWNTPTDAGAWDQDKAAKAATGLSRFLQAIVGEHPTPFEAPTTVSSPQSQSPVNQVGPAAMSASPVGNADLNITSGFGPRGGRLHGGVDIGVPSGSPILAATAGTVTHAGNDDPGGYGTWVEITAPDGTATRYGHMSGINVKQGQTVSAGQIIGASGGIPGSPGAGNSRGAHLHFEVRKGGTPVDPMSFLAGGSAIVGEGQAPEMAHTTATAPRSPEAAAESGVEKVKDALRGDPVEDTPQGQQAGQPAQAGGTLDQFLAAIRQVESGGNYSLYNTSGLSDASGAYQFISTTWGGYGGYRNAAQAPPQVQDEKARMHATELFNRYGDWRLVAIAWYGGPGIADQVARGVDPGSPKGQGPYLAYGDKVMRLMGTANG